MRITVWGINYAPEMTGIAPYNAGLCEFLARRGHDVRMVTAFPYYPSWRKMRDDHGRLYRTDTMAGVPVHRCWHYVPAKVTAGRRIIHELSFGFTSFLRLLVLPRADVYVVVSPPLVLGLLAWILTLLKQSRYVFHVQDLQPDAALGLKMLRPGMLTRMLYGLETIAYRHAMAVSGISTGMLRAFERKGVPTARRWKFPNWVPSGPASTEEPDRIISFRALHGIPASTFLAVYSGNLGQKQGLSGLVEAARHLGSSDIRVIIAGDGALRTQLEAMLREHPEPHVQLLPLQPAGLYRSMLAEADLAIITQVRGTGQFFFPSKLLSVLSAGRPVLAIADLDSELAQAVAEGGFGYTIAPDHAPVISDALQLLAGDADRLSRMASAGRRWVAAYTAEVVLDEFEHKLREITPPEV